MSKRSILTFRGVLVVIDGMDCLGVPIFGETGMNFDLVAEADGDLVVTQFVELFPGHGYSIKYLQPGSPFKRKYSIGEPTPIPFVCDSRLEVIMGDRHASDLGFVAPTTEAGKKVKERVGQLLHDAREGVFRKRFEEWASDKLQVMYPEIFEERPSNSRYWVSRWRLAVKGLDNSPRRNRASEDAFRKVGTRWLELFGAKTEIDRLMMLLGDGKDGVFSVEDAEFCLFGYLSNKFANGEFAFLEKFATKNPTFLGLFPSGLYFFELTHPKIKTPFKFLRPEDFLAEIKRRLLSYQEGTRLPAMRNLCLVLFGVKDAPIELIGTVSDIRRIEGKRFREARDYIKRQTRELQPEFEGHYVLSTITSYDNLVELEAVEYGNARLASRLDDFLADDKELIDELRSAFY